MRVGPMVDESLAREQRRIFHPDYFPRYFILGVPASHISEGDMTRFLDALGRARSLEEVAGQFQTEFAKLENGSLKRWRFLDMLVGRVGALPEIAAEGLAFGVAGASEDLASGFLTLGEDVRARALIFVVAEKKSASPRVEEFLE